MLIRALIICSLLAISVSSGSNIADAGKSWKGPTPTGPEKPLWPSAKREARKDLRQARKIVRSWENEFKAYEGYYHNPYSEITNKAFSVDLH